MFVEVLKKQIIGNMFKPDRAMHGGLSKKYLTFGHKTHNTVNITNFI